MKYLLIAQLFFGLGIFAQPQIKAYFNTPVKDVSGYEAIVANIDSGEVYHGH